MNGTLQNYLWHALAGGVISVAAIAVSYILLGELKPWVSVIVTVSYYFGHEVSDAEHSLPGSAKDNLFKAITFWIRFKDGLLDFLSPSLAAVVVALILTGLFSV